MVRKIFFHMFMFVIIGLCAYSIYLMYKTDSNYSVDIEKDDIIWESYSGDLYTVGLENVYQSVVFFGNVAPVESDEIEEVFIEGEIDDIKINIAKGSVLEKDMVYATYSGKEFKSSGKMRCTDIVKKTEGVQLHFINYGKLYIEMRIPEKYASDSLVNKEITIFCADIEFNGIVEYLDGYCYDGYVLSYIRYDNEEFLLRPGAECNTKIIVSQKEDVVAVPLEFVIYSENENEYRIMVVNGNSTMTKKVEIGIIGDDKVEIISGLDVGEQIVMPRDEMSLSHSLRAQGENHD